MNAELVRVIDSIHREKDISLDILFGALEDAMASALRKRFGALVEITVSINRETGDMTVQGTPEPVDPASLGRIAAQAAKQVIIQKIREAERDVIFHDYEARVHDIVNGTVQRIEGTNVIINLGKTEALLPRREQVREEHYRVGDRVRCYVVDVKKIGSSVKIIVSRGHADLVRKLFELEVPEIAERIIEVKGIAREPGYRTKIAVYSVDSKVDAVGACVGVRGTRIKNIVAELGGERIDIVRWSDQPDILIANALNPAEIQAISLNPRARLARVIVAEDQLSRAIGALGQNVRLAAKLTGWDIDVMSQQELDGEQARMKKVFAKVGGVGPRTIAKLFAANFSVKKLATASLEAVLTIDGIGEATAQKVIDRAAEFIAEERAQTRARKTAEQAAAAAADEATEAEPAPEEPDAAATTATAEPDETAENAQEEPPAADEPPPETQEPTDAAPDTPGEAGESDADQKTESDSQSPVEPREV